MKKIIMLAILSVHFQVLAEPVESTRVLKDSTTWVALELNDQTVFCTARGYGSIELKVSVPDLDWLAHFDHRVVGEGQPCITGGSCTDILKPGNIVNSGDPIVVAPMRVALSEVTRLDRQAKICERQLQETIQSTIRGHEFNHYRGDTWKPAKFEICEKEAELQGRK